MDSIVKLVTGEFPYLIREDGNPIVSLTKVSRLNPNTFGQQDLFFFVNALISTTNTYDQVEAFLAVRHSFATDTEDDTATIGQLTLSSFQFMSADYGLMRFSAWVTEMNFYPTEQVEDPFKGAVDKPGYDSHGYSKNRGYPYLPPTIRIGNNPVPFQVKIETYMNGQYGLDDWVSELTKRASDVS